MEIIIIAQVIQYLSTGQDDISTAVNLTVDTLPGGIWEATDFYKVSGMSLFSLSLSLCTNHHIYAIRLENEGADPDSTPSPDIVRVFVFPMWLFGVAGPFLYITYTIRVFSYTENAQHILHCLVSSNNVQGPK